MQPGIAVRKGGSKNVSSLPAMGNRIEAAVADIELINANARDVNSASRDRAQMVADLVAKSRDVGAQINAIGRTAGDSAQLLESIGGGMADMLASVGKIVQSLARCADATADIGGQIEGFQRSFDLLLDLANQIDTVARQTNLLSLNAMIEARHAGDAGRGFAVVATEVRDLSRMVGNNAHDIRKTLSALQTAVDSIGTACGNVMATLQQESAAAEDNQTRISEISQIVRDGAATADASAASAAEQVEAFGALIAELQKIQSDTEAAIKGSATNVEISARAIGLLRQALAEIRHSQAA